MSGYWNRSSSHESFLRPSCKTNDGNSSDDDGGGGGWMLTNDLGYIHPRNGKLYFRGRADDVIRTGGESVLASDVERVILDFFASTTTTTTATIVECAVFPLPDEKFGEAVCAAVVVGNAVSEASFLPSSAASSSVIGKGGADGIAPTSFITPDTANNKNADNNTNLNIAATPTILAEEDEELKNNLRRYFAMRQIAGYKRPRHVFVIHNTLLPRNSSGKMGGVLLIL